MDDVRHTSLRGVAHTSMQKVDDQRTSISSRNCLGTSFIGGAGVLPGAMSALVFLSAFSAATAF